MNKSGTYNYVDSNGNKQTVGGNKNLKVILNKTLKLLDN